MSLHFNKITDAISKSASLSVKEKTRLLKELEKTEKTIHGKDALLSSQARELEIEAALERVRTRAMAMHRGDELAETSIVFFNQLLTLGIKPRACGFLIMDEESQTMEDWSANIDEHGKAIHVNSNIAFDQHPMIAQVVETWRRGDPYFIGAIHGEELQKYYEAVTTKETSSKAIKDKVLSVATSEYTNSFYFEYGMMYVLTAIPLSEHEINIILRFAGVLKLTYRRFLDLQKAEAQAREAQIEVALERVRARTMAMQRSEELAITNTLVVEQINLLINSLFAVGIHICHSEKPMSDAWIGDPVEGQMPYLVFDHSKDPFAIRIYREWKNGNPFHFETLEGKDLIVHFRFMATQIPNREAFDPRSFPSKLTFHLANFATGFLVFVTTEECPQEHDIFKRFAKVFEQTYTRFLDIQKAEAQAREAQIEAALEKVRSRTMGMHQSGELKEVVSALYWQLDALGLADWGCSIMIFDEKANHIENWIAESTGSDLKCFVVEGQGHRVYKKLWQHWKKQGPPLRLHHTDEKKREFDRYWLNETGFSTLPEKVKRTVLAEREIFLTYINMHHGLISVSGYARLPDDKLAILQRFAKVFEQTYTRFLDLKNAEAQAREAQIEAALERVRSQAMAMRESADLLDIVVTMRTEFINLGHEAHYFWHMRWLPEIYEKAMTSGDGTRIGMVMNLPRHMHGDIPLLAKWEKGKKPTVIYAMDVEAALAYVDKMVSLGDFQQVDPNAPSEDDIRHIGGLTFIMARTTHGEIGYSLPGVVEEIPKEDLELLERFAGAFDLAHKRFEDLIKSEQQAREVQIELALEKVRSRTMAMQHSDELSEAANVLFLEVQNLGIPAWSCGYNILSDDKKSSVCIMSSEGELQEPFVLPLTEHKSLKPWHNAILNHEKFFVYGQDGEDLVAHYKYMKSLPELKGTFEQFEKAGLNLPVQQFNHLVRFNEGFLLFITYEAVPEAHDIFKRFGKVFAQTYTRFLDLQIAEAQAREAQIEAALERVRSRSMGMQNSEELKDVVKVIFDQLAHLSINAEHAGIVIDYEPTKDWHFWIAETQDIPAKVTVPYLDLVWDRQFTEAKKKGKDFFTTQMDFKEKNSFYKVLLPHIEGLTNKARDFYFSCPGLAISTVIEKDIGLYIENFSGTPYSSEENDILKRFAKVFQQTYTRFLDLQKAEAQAREAQIEAALERVRSRSMAMYKSEELAELSLELVKQVQALGVATWFCAFNIYDDDPKGSLEWGSNGQGTFPKYRTPMEGVFLRYYEAGQRGETLLINEIGKKECPAHYDYLCTLPGVGEQLLKMKDAGIPFPNSQIDHVAYFKYGYVLFITYEPSPESHEIFTRFAKVFEQTYTRFLDLKKAEAQAREAQIENALEKVRSRTMAMYKSEELSDTAQVLYEQFSVLGNIPDRMSIGIFKEETKEIELWGTDQSGSLLSQKFSGSLRKSTIITKMYKAWKAGNDSLVADLSGQNLKIWLKYIREELKLFVDDSQIKGRRVQQAAFFSHGFLLITTNEPIADEIIQLLIRFAGVFSQTYTRFLDLQKAEAQAREAQIENALEKVRSRTMAMQKGEEVKDVVVLLYKELIALGVDNFVTCGYVEINEKINRQFTWVTSPGGDSLGLFYLPLTGDATFDERYAAWKKQQIIFHQKVAGEVRSNHLEYAITTFNSKEAEEMVRSQFPDPCVFYCFNFSHGYLHLVTGSKLKEEEESLLARFTRVFEQTYARFLDLKKAEAQAREAQVDTALEKVRSRSLAMHTTGEMQQVANAVYEQLHELGLKMDAVGMSGVIEAKQDYDVWVGGASFGKALRIPYNEDTKVQRDYNKAIKTRHELFAKTYSGKVKEEYINHLLTHGDFPKALKKKMVTSNAFSTSIAFAKNSGIQIARYTNQPYTEEENGLLKRFAKVFEQAYIRFMDLQKAEAQARESQIEVALERVRSRAMAMHHTDELTDVLGVLFDQFDFLGINPVLTHLTLFDEANETFTLRIARGGKKRVIAEQLIDVNAVESWKTSFANWKKSELHALDCIDYPPEVLPAVWQVLDGVMTALPEGQKIYPEDFPNGLYTTQGHCKYGYIGFNHSRRATEEEKDIVIRFAKEFGRLYQRFLDIKKAELQAREAQIEGALERVRSKTMAMHNSEDLEDIVISLFDEVMNLGLDQSIRCGIGILEGHEGMETRSVNKSSDGTVKLITGMLDMTIHPMLVGLKKAWKNKSAEYSYDYTAKDVRKYYEVLNKEPEYPFNANLEALPEQEFHRSFFYSSGILFAFSENPISEESSKVLARFASVFGQTYRRFLDLQKAEERAKDAVKQASLDRVRGQIASMRSTQDLERITPLVWNELTTLGIPFIRCGVFIIDEPTKTVQAFLSAPDGHSLGAMKIPFDADKDTDATVAHWKKGKVYRTHWDKSKFLEFMQLMIDLGQVSNEKEYQGAEQPPESLHLHFIPFTQGMLYVGNVEPLAEDQIESVQSLADAFAIAYARYEDFSKLEKAKEQVETTLSELKATQNQLVQSEKMASLGELTAGIAHEIQNPLNFVNNFSEVSKELIEEMLIEMQKGDVEEVKALADDIIQNLEKIHHHGQRADGIVKGMLQHSRSGSGEKEPTDLNVLADEYLRLAYHGLRAKDKTFNATLETHFDESIGQVNVMAQDIGRVILNLITNAFYVVKEKKEQQPDDFVPTVNVTTRKEKGKVLVIVRDNGNGIPKKIRDKIFQPFFTTKPTGQGTGLGLSLSYDIVKSHGGELKVESHEGEGTEFTIMLPSEATKKPNKN